MSDLCQEFGISREVGYKVWDRYQAMGVPGLGDQRHGPKRIPHRTSEAVKALVIEARKAHPTWGPKKLYAWLSKNHPGVTFPAPSTMGDQLAQAGLVEKRVRVRRASGWQGRSGLMKAGAPNDLWCIDFKGQFRLGNGTDCYPITITDQYSRYLLACEALDSTEGKPVKAVMEGIFKKHGLPRRIRSDNGEPFASTGLFGLSQLSAWWIQLGVEVERIEPGHPEQNGAHERMHLTLKKETTRPAAENELKQQERFDRFQKEFTEERPHEALNQTTPAEHYRTSERAYPGSDPTLLYPLHDRILQGNASGHLRLGGRGTSFYLSSSLSGQSVGLRELENQRWLVTFAHLDVGHDEEQTQQWIPLDGGGRKAKTIPPFYPPNEEKPAEVERA